MFELNKQGWVKAFVSQGDSTLSILDCHHLSAPKDYPY